MANMRLPGTDRSTGTGLAATVMTSSRQAATIAAGRMFATAVAAAAVSSSSEGERERNRKKKKGDKKKGAKSSKSRRHLAYSTIELEKIVAQCNTSANGK
jgi:hypothetical protein